MSLGFTVLFFFEARCVFLGRVVMAQRLSLTIALLLENVLS